MVPAAKYFTIFFATVSLFGWVCQPIPYARTVLEREKGTTFFHLSSSFPFLFFACDKRRGGGEERGAINPSHPHTTLFADREISQGRAMRRHSTISWILKLDHFYTNKFKSELSNNCCNGGKHIVSVNHINGDAAKSDMCPLPFPSLPILRGKEVRPSVCRLSHILCRAGHVGMIKKGEWKRFYSVSISREEENRSNVFCGRVFFPFVECLNSHGRPSSSISKKGWAQPKIEKKGEESEIGLWEKELGKGMMTPPPSLFFSFPNPTLSLLFLLPRRPLLGRPPRARTEVFEWSVLSQNISPQK